MKDKPYFIIIAIILITFIAIFIYNTSFSPLIPPKNSFSKYNLIKIIKPPIANIKGAFGSSLCMEGNQIIIGESGNARVHIYDYNGNIIKTITTSSDTLSSGFGSSVATNGEIIVVGEPRADVDGVKSAGLIHIYDMKGEQHRTIKSPSPYEGAGFGFSLAIWTGGIVVSEPGPLNEDENLHTRVYLLSFDGTYLGSIERPQLRRGSFGWAVDVYDEVLAVGEPYAVIESPVEGYTHGLVHLYRITSRMNLTLITSLRSSTGRGFGSFGHSVSVSKDLVAVGEIRGDVNNTQMAGIVHLYTRNGDLINTLLPSNLRVYGYFGLPVKITDTMVLVGQRNSGFVYLYDHEGHLLVTISQDGVFESNFGEVIALSGDIIAIGAPASIIDGKKAGEVYLFKLS